MSLRRWARRGFPGGQSAQPPPPAQNARQRFHQRGFFKGQMLRLTEYVLRHNMFRQQNVIRVPPMAIPLNNVSQWLNKPAACKRRSVGMAGRRCPHHRVTDGELGYAVAHRFHDPRRFDVRGKFSAP